MPLPRDNSRPPAGPASARLDLAAISRDAALPPGGEELYRQIGQLTELSEGMEILDAASGRGTSTLYLARTFGVAAVGVESDPALVEQALAMARDADPAPNVTFEAADLTDLPYRDGIFDVAIGELGLAGASDPARAVAELARVTRPMGTVVLVQLTWTGNVDPAARESLVRHLGVRPLILVEWKQLLRDAGVVELSVEDWSDAVPFRSRSGRGGRGAPEEISARDQVAVLLRAWRQWGWRGVRGALVREREIRRMLTRERTLGLTLIRGTRWHSGAAH